MSKAEPNPKADGRMAAERPRNRRRSVNRSPAANVLAEDHAFWAEMPDYELHESPSDRKPMDLLERTALFGQAVVRFAKRIPRSVVNDALINQLVRSGTSVGANYCEADDPLSRKDYLKSIGTCRKESKETKYWLHMIATAEPSLQDDARILWKEAKELNLIFGSIFRKK